MLPLNKLSKYITSNNREVSADESVKTSLIINHVCSGIHIIIDNTDDEKTYIYYMQTSDKLSAAYVYQDKHAWLEIKGLLYRYNCWYRSIYITDYFTMRCPYIIED